MIKRALITAGVLGTIAIAAPASAVTFTGTNGSAEAFAASAVGAQYTFETSTTGNVGNPIGFVRVGGLVANTNMIGVGANPFGAPAGNSYLYVTAGQASTISAITTAITGYSTISVYLGSIDAGNTIEVLGAGGAVLRTYVGSDLTNPTGTATGAQTIPGTNRAISFMAGAGEVLTGIRFSSSVNSLETDNVRFTTAVPEPATWAMMLVGFGFVGMTMRSRRRRTNVVFG